MDDVYLQVKPVPVQLQRSRSAQRDNERPYQGRAADRWHRVVGVFVAEDPKAEDALAKKGQLALDFGQLWMKGQHIATGQAKVKAYNRKLRDLIAAGKAKPSEIISHRYRSKRRRRGMPISTPETKDGPRSC
jgi:hypothetical protein